MTTKLLYTLPQFSQEFNNGGETATLHGDYVIRFQYFRDREEYCSGIKFKWIRFVSYTAQGVMQLYQIQPLDSIIEIMDSDLLNQINQLIIERSLNYPNPFHHYIICFDGCYEIIAENWELLPEEKIS